MKRWRLRKRDYAASSARRQAFRAFLAEHVCPATLYEPELVFGELVTNAVRHGDDPISVQVDVFDSRVRIQVENGGNCFDLQRRLLDEPKTTSGRGLRIVRALADEFTVELIDGASCRVTAELAVDAR